MKYNFTNQMIFGFAAPNFCLLGNEQDFRKLAKCILDLTIPDAATSISLQELDFMVNDGENKNIIFSSKIGSDSLGIFKNDDLIFELDSRFWERLFKFFILMSWDKATYYLNSFEDCLKDLPLVQQCHFICSSEF